MSEAMPSWDELMEQWTQVYFAIALDVPVGQKWGEFEKDGKPYAAFLEGTQVYVCELPSWWKSPLKALAEVGISNER